MRSAGAGPEGLPTGSDPRAQWARIRARGLAHFVLTRGVLAWGGVMFVLMGLGFTSLLVGPQALDAKLLAVNASLWLSGGLLFGLLTWRLNERKFHGLDAGNGQDRA